MAELYCGSANVFIPGDLFQRLELLYNLSVTLLSRDGRLIVQADADARNIAVLKEAKSYLRNLFNLDTKQTHPLLLNDVWRSALENNLRAILFFEQTFCLTVFYGEGMFYSHGAESNAEIFTEMVSHDPESALQTAIKANEFLNCVPFGHLIRTSPQLTERMKQCIAYSICKRNYQRKSYSSDGPKNRSSQIHADIDLAVVDVGEELPDLESLVVLHRTYGGLREIPADIFDRIRNHFGLSLFIYTGQSHSIKFTTLEATNELARCRTYITKLLSGLSNENYQTIPVVWQEAFMASTSFLSYLEKCFSIMLIFDTQTRALAVIAEPEMRETLVSHLFTEKYADEDRLVEMSVALHVVFNKEDISNDVVRRLPHPVIRRLAGFIERFADPEMAGPKDTSVIVLGDSEEEESVVEFIDLTIDGKPQKQPDGLLRKIDALSFSMKVKLTKKTEKAMCLGFSLVDIIKSIIEKEPDRAALLSDEHFIGMLCDRQVSTMTTHGSKFAKVDTNYTPLQKRFKRSFENEYPTLRPLANSEDRNNPATTKRHKLLIAVLKEYLGRLEKEDEEEIEELKRKSTAPIYPDLSQHRIGSGQVPTENSGVTPTGVATKLVPEPSAQSTPFFKGNQFADPIRPSILSPRLPLHQNPSSSVVPFMPPLTHFSPMLPTVMSQAQMPQVPMPQASMPQAPIPQAPMPQAPLPQVSQEMLHSDQNGRQSKFRPVIIDGCNVAYSHGKNRFSAFGMVAAVKEFQRLGCTDIHVMLPRSRQGGPGAHHIADLERRGILTFTPSRCLEDKSVGRKTYQTPYDDRLILRAAVDLDGVVVSNDNFRDIKNENREFEDVVNNRTLMYCFVGDKFLVADDPFGPSGPSLKAVLSRNNVPGQDLPRQDVPRQDVPRQDAPSGSKRHRTFNETMRLREQLSHLLPDQTQKIQRLLEKDRYTTDPNILAIKLLSH